ncbi:Holliday junction resolvase RuvX [Clostridia bacterium]|nr:Holliday junction resolvase RuvX [Clostridia bacterium]
MRVMAVDYGDSRTGVAISDVTATLVGDAFTLSGKRSEVVDRLVALCAEQLIGHIVLGYPRHMNGDVGERANISEKLAETLRQRTALPVTLWDERLTSVAAHNILKTNKRRNHKATVDAIAASLMLEEYLSRGEDHLATR